MSKKIIIPVVLLLIAAAIVAVIYPRLPSESKDVPGVPGAVEISGYGYLSNKELAIENSDYSEQYTIFSQYGAVSVYLCDYARAAMADLDDPYGFTQIRVVAHVIDNSTSEVCFENKPLEKAVEFLNR